ncbi:MAG: Stp1/IreP family PP2C-type Ser/Thr phosphatase [Clostridioides sp.]|jgi:protein phosphatase|nr:Stp1/IreP family PP2C-type Ser/Thr phosphatase [Clostridioides sp.]
MEFSSASHIGKIRKNNEDYCRGEIVETEFGPVGVFAIADGMGGHNKGEVASKLAVTNIIKFLKENILKYGNIKLDYMDDVMRQAYNSVNKIIFDRSKESPEYFGMGTTLVTAIVFEDNLCIANVGDSRGYILHDRKFDQITTDHSLVAELVSANIITEEEARVHPQRNRITRAMGTDSMVAVDIFKYKLRDDDIILMATDGLTGFVEYKEIRKTIIDNRDDLNKTSESLINIANDISGKDNVSVILIGI